MPASFDAKLTCGREQWGKLSQVESHQHRGHIGVVGKVKIQSLVEGKRGRAPVQCQVGLGIRIGENMAVQASKNLCDPSDTDRLSRWRLEVVVPRKCEIDCILKAFPLRISEQITKRRVTKCNGLERTQRLCAVIQHRQLKKADGKLDRQTHL